MGQFSIQIFDSSFSCLAYFNYWNNETSTPNTKHGAMEIMSIAQTMQEESRRKVQYLELMANDK